MQQTNMNNEALQPGSTATPFSTCIWAVVSGDVATVEARLADDVEWDLMPNNHIIKGKEEVIPWMKAGGAGQKELVTISNLATKEWGVFECWEIGTFTKDVAEFFKQQGWPFPEDPISLVGRKHKVAKCFVYHLNAEGKIDVVREYLDASSVIAQLSKGIQMG